MDNRLLASEIMCNKIVIFKIEISHLSLVFTKDIGNVVSIDETDFHSMPF